MVKTIIGAFNNNKNADLNRIHMKGLHCHQLVRNLTSHSHGAPKAQKQKVLILGTGWAGYRCASDLDKSLFDVHVISPRNHFLFTPLLPSTAVGTLEFRAIQEPIRMIPNIHYYQAHVTSIDLRDSSISCVDAFSDGHRFQLVYDALIVASGSETNTFGVKGVSDNPHVFFLKQLQHSRSIRNRLIECFERASSPSVTSAVERQMLLTFVVVGGGPTSVEFAAELYDFLRKDVSRYYPELLDTVRVQLIEASGHILGSFDSGLVGYVESLFKSRRIEVISNTSVREVVGNIALLSDGRQLSFGMMVWSTGVQQTPLINSINEIQKHRNGRLMVDAHLRVLSHDSGFAPSSAVFAVGDCAADVDKPLPMLAQVRCDLVCELMRLSSHTTSTTSSCTVGCLSAGDPPGCSTQQAWR